MSLRLGVDIGGTFTDFTMLSDGGELAIWKEDTTPDDPTRAIDTGLRALAEQRGTSLEGLLGEASAFYHGTTIATNEVIQRSGPTIGLLCTEGFRDVLYLRNGFKPERFNMHLVHPRDFVDRRLRLAVRERTDYRGEEIIPLNEDDVREAARRFKRAGVAAVGVAFLWSVADPGHEKRAAEILRQEMPGVYVLCSSDVLPEIREWERTSATVMSSYLLPGIHKYLRKLERYLDEAGLKKPPLIMQINGGCAHVGEILQAPVNMLHSGPAAGPAAGLFHAQEMGARDILTIDMGGTSFDVCLVRDGHPSMSRKMFVEDQPIGVAAVDVHSVGAGGGSIAWIDAGGALRVGPHSAGSQPGPAAYGFGGDRPTVTDANVVLGYLSPEAFLGGRRRLRKDLAERAIQEHIAAPLGLDLLAAAQGIARVVNTNMVNAIRAVSVERGIDPRGYLLIAGGGAGGLHAASLARELGIAQVLIPRDAGVFCSFGMLVTDVRHDSLQAYHTRSDTIDLARLDTLYATLESAARERLGQEGFTPEEMRFERWVDARYPGQVHEVTIPVPSVSQFSEADVATMQAAFHELHEREFTYARRELEVEFLHWRLGSFGLTSVAGGCDMTPLEPSPELAEEALAGELQAYFPERGVIATPAFDAERLKPGAAITGPAVIQAATTTIVVNPSDSLVVNRQGSFVLAVGTR